MAKKKIVWTETASRQRRQVLKYWTERNKSAAYAIKLIKITKDRLKTISKNPGTNKKTEFADTRVAAMGHFSIFYKEEKEQIIVTAFWDNRQDPKKLLELLKK
jgi:plasmid stabilization system protein ParE